MNTKKNVLVALKIVVSISLLAYLFTMTDMSAFWARILELSPAFVLFAWVYYSACQWVSAYRWQMFLAAKHIHVKMKTLFSFYMVGMFLNNFLPGAVGGDAVKCYDLYRHTDDGNISIASVFLERFTGLIGLVVISVFAAVFGMGDINSDMIYWVVWGTVAFLSSIILLIWSGPGSAIVMGLLRICLPAVIGKRLVEIYNAVHSYSSHRLLLFKTILISIVLQFLFALYYAFTAIALGIDVDLIYFLLFLPVVTIVTMIPISFGGLGIREGLMVVLFAEAGVSSADIMSISLTVYIINTMLSLLGGGIYITRRSPGENKATKA